MVVSCHGGQVKKSVRLDRREYRYKNPTLTFLCPLCSTQRVLRYRPHLSILNYIQITFLSAASIYLTYPLMGMRSFFIFFIFWIGFEGAVRILFKKDLPCPHCGFDAAWYKRDVKVTRTRVQEFWDKKEEEKTLKDSESDSTMPPPQVQEASPELETVSF